jgi:hypothetical protein
MYGIIVLLVLSGAVFASKYCPFECIIGCEKVVKPFASMYVCVEGGKCSFTRYMDTTYKVKKQI